MIEKEHVIQLIPKVCPSFKSVWEKCDDQKSLYVVMGNLARHLLRLVQDKKTVLPEI